MAFGSQKRHASSDANISRDYKRMSVSSLRQKLDNKNLDVDGSKEMLVSRLEGAEAEALAQVEALAQAEVEAENEDEDDQV